MTQSTNKFEQLLELLINEENDKAEQMFHEIVVEKSRDIYENLADSETATTEAKDEAKEEDKKEEVKETEASATESKEDAKEDEKKDDEVKETKDEEAKEDDKKDEGVILQKPQAIQPTLRAPVEKSDEESIEEIGGDATDQLVKDIASDEEGEADAAADDMAVDMDANGDENGEGGDTEERVSDLEDALDELKAEFEKMLAGANGEEEAEETAIAPAPETQPELARVEGKEAKDDAKAETKETVKEYAIKKSADNADHSEKSAKSPVAVKGGAKSGATPVKTGSGSEDKGRPAPTAQKMGSFENSPGKDKGTSMKKEVKADTKDGSEKSAKSPIGGK